MNRFNNMTDDQLVKLYSGGCNKAFDTLLNRYDSTVHAYIRFNIKDDDVVEDIFQDSFIKVMKTIKRGQYKAEGKFRQWLMRLVHNSIIDFFRREKLNNRITSIDYNNIDGNGIFSRIATDDKNSEELIMIADTIDELYRKLELLPQEQREVVQMRYWDDMSFKEIADITGVSINTALGRMRYALMNLRKS